MAQQRRVRPAVGVAAVGLGIGAGALGLYRGAVADPPRPLILNTAPVSQAADRLLTEGRELVRQNKLAEALAKADAAARQGATTAADTLRRDILADGRQQIEDLTTQAKVLAGRGDATRSKASLDLARQIAAEIGQPTAPPTLSSASSGLVQAVVFRPADPPQADPAPPITVPPPMPKLPEPAPLPPAMPTLPVAIPNLPPAVPALPDAIPVLPPPAASVKPLLPAVSALTNSFSGLAVPPAIPVAGGESPAPGATPVTLSKLAVAAVGAALATAPAPAQDAAPKPGPGTTEVARPLPVAPAPTPAPVAAFGREQLDGLKADVSELKDYKRQVQDLLQGKADGSSSVLDAGVLKRLTDLERKLESLEKSVEAVRAIMTRLEAGSTSLKPSAPAVKTAVRLVNDYPSDLSLILNGASHRLKQGEAKTVDVPPGSFTYELIADGATAITRIIRAEETVTLRIK